jgi:hypothetical protein
VQLTRLRVSLEITVLQIDGDCEERDTRVDQEESMAPFRCEKGPQVLFSSETRQLNCYSIGLAAGKLAVYL